MTTDKDPNMNTSFFRIETRPSGVKILWLDVPGKVNVLKMAVIRELDRLLDWLANDSKLKGVVIASAKPGMFIAGADINEIRWLQDQPVGEAFKLTQEAKAVFKKLRLLGVPSVAAIDGACKGGGLELALWCMNRIATDDVKTVFALPEVRLGVAPGFGGCVLLPRLIDTVEAVTMIASGADMSVRDALAKGIVDEIVPALQVPHRQTAQLIARAEEIALGAGLSAAGKKEKEKAAGRAAPFMEKVAAALLNLTEPLSPDIVSPLRRIFAPPVQALPAQAVVAEVKKKAKGYGAPGRAAGIVLKTLVMPLDKALEYESAEFANLSQSRESRNLVSIFLDRSSAKKLNGDAVGLKVESLAIIGSGIMGREIAFEALYADEIDQVVLIDVKEEFLAKARAHMEELMASRVRSGKIAELNAKAKFNKLTTSTDYGAIVDCDAVIEAVPETYAMKSQCYEQIDHAMSGRTKTTPYFIFSNTSALSLTRLSQSVRFPANFSGLHFFNPVSQMAGVEIPTAQGTSDETLSTAIRLVGALGKIPLPCREHPGFIVNAILGAELVVTDHLLSMGVAPSVIDKAMLTFGMPMGPVELMDYVGLDVVLSVAKTLREVHGDRLALPADDVVARLVERGYLGRKSGQGFYLWKGERTERDEKTRLPVLNPALAELLPGPGNMNMASEAVQELLVGAIESEAVRVLEAGVVAHPFLIDLAFVVSTGFTASLGGPIRHIDQRGVKTFYDLMSDIADGAELPAQGWRRNFVPPALLAEHARERTNLYGP